MAVVGENKNQQKKQHQPLKCFAEDSKEDDYYFVLTFIHLILYPFQKYAVQG